MAASGIKSLAKDTAIYGVSSIVGRLLNYLLVPLYTSKLFTTAEYGTVTNMYAYVALVMVILTFGMETTFFRFINKKEENPTTVYSTVLLFVLSLAILFLALCFTFIDPISAFLKSEGHKDFVLIMAVIVAFDSFTAIPFAYLRYQKRPIRFATFKMLHIILTISLNLFLLLLCPWIYKNYPQLIDWFYNPSYGIGYIFVANLIPSIILALILIPDYTGFKYKIDKDLLKRMIRYSFPLVILGITGIMNQTIDKLLYPSIIYSDEQEGFRQLGIYSAGTKIAVAMTMFTQAFRFAYEPFIFAQNKGKDDRMMYSKAMTYFTLLGLVMFLAITFYIDIFKYIQFIGPHFFDGLVVVPIVLLGELLFGIYFNLSLWFKLTDKTKYGAYFSAIGFVIIVTINIVFVPIYGFIASAWASLICYLVMTIVSYFYGQKYYPIQYEVKKLFIYVALALLFYFMGTLPNIENKILELVYRTLLLLGFIAIIIKKDIPLSEIPFINKYIKTK